MNADRRSAHVASPADDAIRRGDWLAARDAFAAAAEAGDAAAWSGVAMASRNLGELDAAIAARERSLALHRASGDMRAAGTAAAWLAHDTALVRGDMAVARGF